MRPDQLQRPEYRRREIRRIREVPKAAASTWCEGKKKWLALLASGAAFSVWGILREQNPIVEVEQRAEAIEPQPVETTVEYRKKEFVKQLAELRRIDQLLETAQFQIPEPSEHASESQSLGEYEVFLKLVYEDEDFADFQFEKLPEGGYMIAPKDDLLEFSGVDVTREEDGTFTLGTASGLDLPMNVDAGSLRQALLGKLELSKLYRERIASESRENAEVVAQQIMAAAAEQQIPLNWDLVKEKIPVEGDADEFGIM